MSHGNTTAASVVKSLRIKALLDEVPKNKIARELGVSRPTVAKRLKSDDMKLSEFIQTARILGADPVQVLDAAIRDEKTKKPADASRGQGNQLKGSKLTQDNNLQPFDFEGNEVRVMRDGNGNPLFCAKDVAKVLGYARPADAVSAHCKGSANYRPLETAGGIQQVRFITEGDMYRLITSSKLPAAERFERWVYDEVLPSIRRHGGYMAGQERMTLEQMALASLKWLQSKVDEQARQLKAQEGKVLFANAVESAKTSILVGDLAKILKGNGVDIGQKRLFAWLRNHGWLIKAKGASWNMPTQKAMDLALFEIKETTVTHADGHTTINKTPKVTGKGQTYFVDLFLRQPTLEAGA